MLDFVEQGPFLKQSSFLGGCAYGNPEGIHAVHFEPGPSKGTPCRPLVKEFWEPNMFRPFPNAVAIGPLAISPTFTPHGAGLGFSQAFRVTHMQRVGDDAGSATKKICHALHR